MTGVGGSWGWVSRGPVQTARSCPSGLGVCFPSLDVSRDVELEKVNYYIESLIKVNRESLVRVRNMVT